MAQSSITKTILILVLAFVINVRFGYAQMLDEDRYKMMVQFLVKNGGKWESQREGFDKTKPGSVSGDGLYCFFDESKNILRIIKVSHFRNSDYTNYERTWYWNAIDKEIKLISWMPKGKVETGIIQVVSEKAFVINSEITDADGIITKRKEESFISSENKMETKVLELVNDEWVEVRTYSWKK